MFETIITAAVVTLLVNGIMWLRRRWNERGFSRRTEVPPAPKVETKKEPTPTTEIFIVAREFGLGTTPRKKGSSALLDGASQRPPPFKVGQELEHTDGNWKLLNPPAGSPFKDEFFSSAMRSATNMGWLVKRRAPTPSEPNKAWIPTEVVKGDPTVIKILFPLLYKELYPPVVPDVLGNESWRPKEPGALLIPDSELVKVLTPSESPWPQPPSEPLILPENPTLQEESIYLQQLWHSELTLPEMVSKTVQYRLDGLTKDLEKRVQDWRTEVGRQIRQINSMFFAGYPAQKEPQIDLDEIVRQELARLATVPFSPAKSSEDSTLTETLGDVFKFMYENSRASSTRDDMDEETKVIFPSD